MERRSLGASGVYVPVVGMGTWKTFDVTGAQRNARKRLVREAIELDVRLYDTSPMYGEAEEVLGDALKAHRDEAFVATKVWASTLAEGVLQVRRALSLYAGRVDVYQIHNLRNWQEHLPELERRKSLDEVGLIGATHYNPAAFPDLEQALRTGRFDMIQVPYNLIERTVEKRILPLAEKLKLGVVVMEPLGTGVLPRMAPPEDALSPYLDDHVRTWPQVCLKWILSDTRINAVIPATSKSEHLRLNAAAGHGRWYDAKERTAILELLTLARE